MKRRLLVEVTLPLPSDEVKSVVVSSMQMGLARVTGYKPELVFVRVLEDAIVDDPMELQGVARRLLSVLTAIVPKSETSFETRSAIAEAERILGKKP